MFRSFGPLSGPRITFGQLDRQAERPETLKDRALQLVIGERIKLAGCADTRDKARADCGQLCEAARPIAKAIPTGLGDYATRTWSDDLSERTPQTAR